MTEIPGYEKATWFAYYDGTDIPVNKPGIKEPSAFAETFAKAIADGKAEMTETDGVSGHYNLDHLARFHTILFKDLFEYAGEIRKVDYGAPFISLSEFEKTSDTVFLRLENEDYLKGQNLEDMADRLSYYMMEVERLHPFLHGNFEAMDAFFTQMCRRVGYTLDLASADKAELAAARRNLVDGDKAPMEAVLMKALVKIQRKK